MGQPTADGALAQDMRAVFTPIFAIDPTGLTAQLPGTDSPQARLSWGELDRRRAEVQRFKHPEAVEELQALINWYWGAVCFLTDVRFGSVRNEATQRVYLYCRYQMDRLYYRGREISARTSE